MRHRVAKKHLNRKTKHRKALFKNLIRALVETGEIKTTESKAKAIKGLTDKLISQAKQSSLAARRLIARFFGRRDVVNVLVDEVAPAMEGRSSGFTRITRLGRRRGDNAMMVKMELVEKKKPLGKKRGDILRENEEKNKSKISKTQDKGGKPGKVSKKSS